MSGAIRASCLRKTCLCLGTPMSYLPVIAMRVVERDAGADVGALPRVLERVEERHRPDQVRGEPGEQQAALLQRLLDQREVEHLEVAQAAVHQLGRARRRAGGEVALLDQPDLEAARHRVQRRSDADDPAADDQHVELTGPELLERIGALIGIEGLGERHGASLSGAAESTSRSREVIG